MSKTKISIGILAYNESASIGTMLNSLLKQSLLTIQNDEIDIEIVVVTNGCTDDTANVAKATLENLLKKPFPVSINWQVCEVKQPGKSNAWNLYVHQFSEPKADYMFLMDADIQFLSLETLDSMFSDLENKPEVWVTVDKPIKDVSLNKEKTLMEKLSVLVSGLSGVNTVEGKPAWICGQLYCSRGTIIRKIWLPTTLSVEDGFIYSMIVTDCLKSTQVPNRVILSPSASHIFEAYTDLNRLLRHEKWLIINNTIDEFVYSDLLKYCNDHQDAGTLIKQRNEEDPLWLNQLIQTSMTEKGWWLIPRFILTRRFQSLFHKPLPKAILLFPLAITAFCVDLIISVQANFDIHQGKATGYWGKQTSVNN